MNICCSNFVKRLILNIKNKWSTKNDVKNAVNVVESFSKAKVLYKTLCKKCHPDRFVEEEKKLIAENLFKRVQHNRYDYEALKCISDEVDQSMD